MKLFEAARWERGRKIHNGIMPAYKALVPDKKRGVCDDFFGPLTHGERLVEMHAIGDYQAS